MEHIRIETDRLILRKFEESDMEAIYSLLSDEEVNTFLPWYPVKDMAEAKSFFEERLRDQKYGFAICLKATIARSAMCTLKQKMTVTIWDMRLTKHTGIKAWSAKHALQ